MLFVFFGNDVTKVRGEAFKKAQRLLVDGGETSIISSTEGSEELLKDTLGATSLFRAHEVFVLDTLSLDAELFESVLTLLPAFKESSNQFVLIEHSFTVKQEKLVREYALEAVKYAASEKKAFNVFGLSDALIARDKKTLWMLLQEAWSDGKTNEEIIGTLFWQLKMLRLAELTKNASEAGQKPFVYDKAKRGLKKFGEGELMRLSHELVELYHEGHSGKKVLGNALEAWILKL